MARKRIIIAGITSDIGCSLGKFWVDQSHEVIGTYRNLPRDTASLPIQSKRLLHCDFSDNATIDLCIEKLKSTGDQWDALVICPATMTPISPFASCDIDDWVKAFSLNFLGAVRFMHGAMKFRSKFGSPIILNFAGGGTNNAPKNVSAYVSSKIALIKLTELLANENPDMRFSILGPGWVKTKIHEEMLQSQDASSAQIAETKRRLKENDFVSMERVVAYCDWVVRAEDAAMTGRNFSVAHDLMDDERLIDQLRADPDRYKLRRQENDRAFGVTNENGS